MKISINLPDEVKGVTYVKNHHWVELEDIHGNKTKLTASALLMGHCKACKEVNIALAKMGNMQCTYCGSGVDWLWTRPQLAFIPQKESDFIAPPQALDPDPDKS